MIGGLFGTVWRNLLITQKFNDIFVYNETTVVITEINQFYYRQFKLLPKLGYPLGDRVMEIYGFNSSCDHLPTNYSITHWHKSNVSGSQNYTHQYLLPGSTLNFTISSINRDSVGVVDMDKPLDVEFGTIKGYIYITRGLEREEFDSMNCQGSSECTIVDSMPFTYGRYDRSNLFDRRGYYNFHSALIDPEYRYTIDLAINATSVDLKQAWHACTISDINEGKKLCTVNLDFKAGLVCFIAYTEYEGNPYIVLNIEVTKQLEWDLVTTVLPPAIVLLMILGCLILCTTINFCCCKRKNQYVLVNVDA